jgi:ABC-type nickel/cobalt efflux system permease component RcnA
MRAMTQGPRSKIRTLAALAIGAALLLALVGAVHAAKSPFGIATPDSTGPAFTGPLGGVFAWVASYQAQFYKALTHALADTKRSGNAFYLLAGISFAYGVFHAVGPGHGKAVITSYLFASRETVKRGIVISLAAAVVQGLVAIIVLVFALSQHLLLAGVGSALAMSFGTFITVSALAVLAVVAKDVALRFAGLESRSTERVVRVVEIGGALAVLLLGLTLLGGALTGGLPN